MFKRLYKDQDGAAAVEAAAVIMMVLLLVGGIVDFFLFLHQYNSAIKAAERGARLAAVSAPVDGRISGVCVQAPCAGVQVGQPLTNISWTSTCRGSSGQCTVTGAHASLVTSAQGTSYNEAAMLHIINGRGTFNGDPWAAAYAIGMRDLCCCLGPKQIGQPCGDPSRDIQPANVTILYAGRGLGFAGNPCGAVPTITVQLTNLQFSFVFLQMIGFGQVAMPLITATSVGEDLWTNGSDVAQGNNQPSAQCAPNA